MNNHIQITTIIILVILNLILVFRIRNSADSVNNFPEKKHMDYIKHMELSIEKNGKTFSDDQLVIDENRDTLLFVDLIQENTLIFYFRQSSCMPCVNESTSLLDDLWVNSNIANIVILVEAQNINELALFKQVNDISCPVYQISEIDTRLLDSHIPIFFTIGKELTVSNLYTVFPGNADVTKNYLSLLISNNLIN